MNDLKIKSDQDYSAVFGAMEKQLQRRIDRAIDSVRMAEEELAGKRDVLEAYQRDGVVPEDVARHIHVRAHDAASTAAYDVLAEHDDRSAFDRAKAVRDAIDRWFAHQGFGFVAEDRDNDAAQGAASESDENVARQHIGALFDARIDAARQRVRDAKAWADSAAEALARFRRDRHLSPDDAEEVWYGVACEVMDVGREVLEGQLGGEAFHEAKAVRGLVRGWLVEHGHELDTSRWLMAELPD